MDAKTWNLIRQAARMTPLALAATQMTPLLHGAPTIGSQTVGSQTVGSQTAGTWAFHHEHVLGTSLELRVRARNQAVAQQAETAALAQIDRQDAILSAWQSDSEFSRWASTRLEPVSVSPELFAVLAGFDRWRAATRGALHPSAEAAARLWQEAIAQGRTPSQTEIAQTIRAIAQPHWQLDPLGRTATRLTGVPLALASFAKSYISSHAADAAIASGASGVMLNVGGDIVVRGDLTQVIAIADPRASAENDPPLDTISLRNRAVATSGSYRRSLEPASSSSLHAPRFSHILDPRTASPTGHVLSSTVIAGNAETAGALATAFSVLQPEESARLAERTPGVDYLLMTQDGRRLSSARWPTYQAAGLRAATSLPGAYAAPTPASGMWNPAFELALAFDIPRIDYARYRRPYIAVWIEDADHFPVRTIALWTQNPRYIPELKEWYRDDRLRNLSEGTDISRTVGSATRPAGHYTLKWDGKDNQGKPVKAGKYTVVVEVTREHGTYQIQRHEMNFGAQPQQASLPGGDELGPVSLDYRKR